MLFMLQAVSWCIFDMHYLIVMIAINSSKLHVLLYVKCWKQHCSFITVCETLLCDFNIIKNKSSRDQVRANKIKPEFGSDFSLFKGSENSFPTFIYSI